MQIVDLFFNDCSIVYCPGLLLFRTCNDGGLNGPYCHLIGHNSIPVIIIFSSLTCWCGVITVTLLAKFDTSGRIHRNYRVIWVIISTKFYSKLMRNRIIVLIQSRNALALALFPSKPVN